jgi:hypothetical protein
MLTGELDDTGVHQAIYIEYHDFQSKHYGKNQAAE